MPVASAGFAAYPELPLPVKGFRPTAIVYDEGLPPNFLRNGWLDPTEGPPEPVDLSALLELGGLDLRLRPTPPYDNIERQIERSIMRTIRDGCSMGLHERDRLPRLPGHEATAPPRLPLLPPRRG